MAEPHPYRVEQDPEHEDRPRGPGRPLLALASLLPLLAAVGAAALVPSPQPVTVERALTTAEAGGARLWCPGPLDPPEAALGVGTDDDLSVIPPSDTVSVRTLALETSSALLFGRVSGSETLLEDDGSVRASSITAFGEDEQPLAVATVSRDLGASVHQATGVHDALEIEATGAQGGRPVSDAVQSTVTTEGDYRSLSISRCLPTATSATFLGVSTQRGASSQLVLRNTGDRPATASVQVWTEDGPAAMEGRSQVVVAPRTEQRILLESVAPGHDHVGVSTEVVGAPLSMHVQTTERDGLTPGGAEILGPLEPAARTVTIPGVYSAAAAPTLILATTQGEGTTATVTAMGADGPLPDVAAREVEVTSGGLVAVPLDGLPAGDHAIRVEAEQPVSAVVRSELTGADLPGDTIGAPVDFAVASPAPALLSHAVAAIPAGDGPGQLVLTSSVDTTVTVVPIAGDGGAAEPVEITLVADTAVSVPSASLVVGGEPAAGISVVPQAPGAVHAGWVQRQSDGGEGWLLSSLPVPLVQNAEEAVSVQLAP